jgi:hypothetical protein
MENSRPNAIGVVVVTVRFPAHDLVFGALAHRERRGLRIAVVDEFDIGFLAGANGADRVTKLVGRRHRFAVEAGR